MANPKIDRQTAEQIRKEWKQGWKQRVLQIRHGLSRAQIGRIVRGEAHA